MGSLQKTTNPGVNLAKTHVPDKVYAYSLQVRHALYELLNSQAGDIVSIEVLEDIAREKPNGNIDVCQIKSVSSDRNPISNRAVDLWKTFYNWLAAIQKNELQIEHTIFELYIINASRKGNIVESFNNASGFEEAENAWRQARLEFYDEKSHEKDLKEEYAYYIREFFNPITAKLAFSLIQRFKLVIIDEAHLNALYKLFCEKNSMISDDFLDEIFKYILGWLEQEVAKKFESGKMMSVSFDDYRSQLRSIYRDLNQKMVLREIAPRPTPEAIQSECKTARDYIKQLEIVDCDYNDKLEAINDYLRACSNRTLWAKRGDISENSFETYQEDLIRHWKTNRDIIKIEARTLSDNEKGKLLFLKCKAEKNVKLGFAEVPSFFTPGCYHGLADDLSIGWHSNYKTILGGQ